MEPVLWDHHPTGRPRFWTAAAKFKGNIMPLTVGAPFFAAGLIEFSRSHRIQGWFAIWMLLCIAACLISLNWLGLAGNRSMKSNFYALHSRQFLKGGDEWFFTGFAWRGFVSLFDPHQDIGALAIGNGRILFFGELFQAEAPIAWVRKVRRKANPHSMLGYGGFLEIEFENQGKTDFWLIELRTERSLRACRRATRKLEGELQGFAAANRKVDSSRSQADS